MPANFGTAGLLALCIYIAGVSQTLAIDSKIVQKWEAPEFCGCVTCRSRSCDGQCSWSMYVLRGCAQPPFHSTPRDHDCPPYKLLHNGSAFEIRTYDAADWAVTEPGFRISIISSIRAAKVWERGHRRHGWYSKMSSRNKAVCVLARWLQIFAARTLCIHGMTHGSTLAPVCSN